MKRISASEFKARCSALLDEVAQSGESLEILKRGKPVARVIRVVADEVEYPQETLKGTVEVTGDIIAPAFPPDAWEVCADS